MKKVPDDPLPGVTMSLLPAARMVRRLLDGPAARPVLLQLRREHFLSSEGCGFYYGKLENFAEARAWLPPSHEFNRACLAAEYIEVRSKRIFAYDYPVLFWLQGAFREGAASELDIGGSVGVHYDAHGRYLQMPAALAWRIVEVPAMVTIGRALATTSAASALSFTDDLAQAVRSTASDVWLSAGALQCLEEVSLAPFLRRCIARPKHVLLNKLPHVLNKHRFIESIEAMGYTPGDAWDVAERTLYLPGFPDRSLSSFSGPLLR
ncbi:methyltransferase, TIGR04325 family [Variovorax sp. J22R24]|uniref:methyltransferase, TIGR04325 family n=1 Tax=Variovorax gracilis TaxID=3053502 RepID=UPI00257848FD|nr:methyltransferase, TIGR04325 family [Variovorax sp. J22R24]MDM0109345.1 methyltransferase, TIGR04325 family [Variovorax sp. J22R24]